MFEAIVNRKGFLNALGIVRKIVPANSPKPIMRDVVLTVNKAADRLLLSGTDLNTAIELTVHEVQVGNKPGEPMLVNAADLQRTVRSMKGDVVTFRPATDKTRMEIAGFESKASLPVHDWKDYPSMAFDKDGDDVTEVRSDELFNAVDGAQWATGEDGRFAYSQVGLDAVDGKLTAYSTDSRRLALATGKCTKISNRIGMLVPHVAADVLTDILDGADEAATVQIKTVGDFPFHDNARNTDRRVLFSGNGFRISATSYDGILPPFKEILEGIAPVISVQFNLAELTDVLDRAVKLRGKDEDQHGPSTIILAFHKGSAAVGIHDPVNADGFKVCATTLRPSPAGMYVGFNGRWLVECIRGVGTAQGKDETVTVELQSPSRPARIVSQDRVVTSVLMPVSLMDRRGVSCPGLAALPAIVNEPAKAVETKPARAAKPVASKVAKSKSGKSRKPVKV